MKFRPWLGRRPSPRRRVPSPGKRGRPLAGVNPTQPIARFPVAQLLHRAWFGRAGRWLRSPIYRLWWRWKRHVPEILAGPLRGHRFPDPEITARLGIADLPAQRWLCERLRPGETAYLCEDNLGLLSLLAAARVGPRRGRQPISVRTAWACSPVWRRPG